MTRARILADYVSSGDELALKAPITNAALVTPNLGTPSAGVMTNVTGMPLAGLSATGTASATTYLRGDNSWQTAGSTSASDLASGTLAAARMVAGSLVQVTTVIQSDSETDFSSLANNTWSSSVVTGAVTPLFDDSIIIVCCMPNVYWDNTTGDMGYALRWERAITGGATSYPNTLSCQLTGANSHGSMYTNSGGIMTFHDTPHMMMQDTPATTSAVTYTLQIAVYNTEAVAVGGANNYNWKLFFMEIKV